MTNEFELKDQPHTPPFITEGLLSLGGKDEFGDPVLRLRFDDVKFKEGMWIVEEKWPPSAFGSRDEWKESEFFIDTVVDFGAFPSRGYYAAVFAWSDHEGKPLPLSQALLDRLQIQQKLREEKNISPEQVAADTERQMAEHEAQQDARYLEAAQDVAESLKKDANSIIARRGRVMSLPKGNIALNNNKKITPGGIITLH